jgi:galactitol-specific phosphotransferase system IIC component
MSADAPGDRSRSELIAVLLPVVVAPLAVAVVVLDDTSALYAGLAAGVGLVALAGVVAYLGRRGSTTAD